jgi:hypothetical protein
MQTNLFPVLFFFLIAASVSVCRHIIYQSPPTINLPISLTLAFLYTYMRNIPAPSVMVNHSHAVG